MLGAACLFLPRLVQVVEGVANPGFFGIRIGEQNAELAFVRVPGNVSVFQEPVIVKKQLPTFDLGVSGEFRGQTK